jgi:hypothetical protein
MVRNLFCGLSQIFFFFCLTDHSFSPSWKNKKKKKEKKKKKKKKKTKKRRNSKTMDNTNTNNKSADGGNRALSDGRNAAIRRELAEGMTHGDLFCVEFSPDTQRRCMGKVRNGEHLTDMLRFVVLATPMMRGEARDAVFRPLFRAYFSLDADVAEEEEEDDIDEQIIAWGIAARNTSAVTRVSISDLMRSPDMWMRGLKLFAFAGTEDDIKAGRLLLGSVIRHHWDRRPFLVLHALLLACLVIFKAPFANTAFVKVYVSMFPDISPVLDMALKWRAWDLFAHIMLESGDMIPVAAAAHFAPYRLAHAIYSGDVCMVHHYMDRVALNTMPDSVRPVIAESLTKYGRGSDIYKTCDNICFGTWFVPWVFPDILPTAYAGRRRGHVAAGISV